MTSYEDETRPIIRLHALRLNNQPNTPMSADEAPHSAPVKPAASPMRCTAASLLLVLLAAPGCMTWNAVQAPALESQPPEAVRVTHVDGSVITLLRPAVRNDSLVGAVEDGSAVIAVALSDVAEIQAREESFGRTLGLLAGLAALGALVVMVIALRSIDLQGW